MPSAVAVTLSDVGSADESGLVLLSKAIVVEPMADHGSSVEGKEEEPWKALFWINSA